MFKSEMKNKKRNIFVLYTCLFLIVCFVSFVPFILRGNSLVPNADGYHQAFPVFAYCREFWLKILKGNFQLFDFSIGLGDDVLFTLNWPGLFDIFSIFSVLIFPAEYIEYAYCFSIVLKLYLSGCAFILFAKRYIHTTNYIVIGALFYSFNIYELFWGMNYSPFLNAPITFPIILYGIDELLDKDKDVKISFAMIVALFIQGINGFYLLYIECMLAIFYFLFVLYFRLCKENNENIKSILNKVSKIIFNGLVGVLLSGIVLIPTIVGLFSSTREIGGEKFSIELFCGMDTFISAIGDLFVPDVYNTVTTLSIAIIGGMIAYTFEKRAKKEFRYMALTLWFLLWIPCWGSIMNGFSYSADRWIFAVSFFGSMATIMVLDLEEKMSGRAQKIYVLIISVSFIIHIIQSEKNIGLIIRVFIFGALALALIWGWNLKNKRKEMMLAIGTVMTMCIGLFTFGPKVFGGCGYSANFKEVGIYNKILNSVKIKESEYEFERWDAYDSSLGASIVANYYGTSEYFSMINSNVSEFYQEMYISPGIKVAATCLRGLDGRQEIESILSVSQYMDFTSDSPGDYVSYIKENNYYIPFGFTYDSYMLREAFEKLNPMEKSSQIVDTIILEEECTLFPKDKKEMHNLEIDYYVEPIDESEITRIYLNYENFDKNVLGEEGELYVSIRNFHGQGYFYIGNKEIEMKDQNYEYYTGIDEFWINVSELKQDSKGYYFEIYFDGVSDFNVSKMNIYWHEIDYHAIKERQKNTLSNLQILTNQVKGEISCSKDEILFLSIPYSVGWRAYVDGEQTDLMKANIGFMAIPLQEGVHNIELLYETPGLKVGKVCSLIALMAIVISLIFIKKNKLDGEFK